MVQQQCISATEVTRLLESYTVPSEAAVRNANEVILLREYRRADCQKLVVDSIVSVIDHTKTEISASAELFNLWSAGVRILGAMKAPESIDFLVSRLDVSSRRFSTTMSQQPALHAVIEIGPTAIASLSEVIQKSADRNMRLYAIYCLSRIGGILALQELNKALPTQTDECVSNFVKVSIHSLKNKNHSLTNTTEWFSAFTCNSRR